jgi:hypothetical protein
MLSQLLRASPSLEVLDVQRFYLMPEHLRFLATLKKHDLEIRLSECQLDPQDQEDTFIEWFQHNQIVTELNKCSMGSRIISALSGNNSVKRLSIALVEKGESAYEKLDWERVCALAQALPTNQGIEDLDLTHVAVSVEKWELLCHSLSTHPRIKFLAIFRDYSSSVRISAAAKYAVMNAILQMLQHNTVVHSIRLPVAYHRETMYQNDILPRLEMNRSCFEVQRQAVKRADPSIRPQLLGGHCTRSNTTRT